MFLLAQMTGSSLAMLLAFGLVIGFLLMRTLRHRSRQPQGPLARVDRPQPYAQTSDGPPPGELSRWEVQMHDTARDLLAQVDTKMGMLQQLTREADRAAERLEQALADPGGQSPPPADLPTAENQARGLTDAANAAKNEPVPAAEKRYEGIYMLADYGFSAAEISQRLGTPVGEVELILGLREKGR